jgi:hypothetical protein
MERGQKDRGREMDTAKAKGKVQVNQPVRKKEGRKADVKCRTILPFDEREPDNR